MIRRDGFLGIALIALLLNGTVAYQPGGHYDVQSPLSAGAPAQDQGACPAQFRGLKPYIHDCRRFINCAAGHPVIQTCAPGKAFNAASSTCDHQSKAACEGQSARPARLQERPLEPRCAPGFSGLQPHPSDCTKYLNCANGQTFVQNCGPGTAFSPTMLVCDYPHKVNCGDGAAYRPADAVEEESEGSSLSSYCSHGAHGEFPFPNDPSKYIRCGYSVQPLLEECPFGQVFNGYSLSCAPAGASAALTDLSSAAHASDLLSPSGVDGLFVHPFDQTKYLSCKAGQVAVLSCSPGHVFSISMGHCHPKSQLLYSDYVAYIVSQISNEYSLMLTRCPEGTDGLHIYPYDAAKYVRCAAGGALSVLSCGDDKAYSYTKRSCLPRNYVTRGERVKFFSELTLQGGSYSYMDSQTLQSALKACPPQLRGNYVYPFHAGYFVLCQNGLLQVEACPAGHVYSLSSRSCSPRQQLSAHDFLDYSYISVQLSTNLMQDFTTVTCPANARGYYLHPFDCTKYLFCHDQQTSIESCEGSEVFSISQRRCVARDQLVAAYDRVEYLTETQHEFSQGNRESEGRQLHPTVHGSGALVCPSGVQGVHPHPYDCTKFLNCANGQTFIQDCGPGTAFSSTLLVCDFKDKVDCGQYHGGSSSHGTGTQYHGGSSGHGSGTEYYGGLSGHGTDYHGGSSGHGSGTGYHSGSSGHGAGTDYHGDSSGQGTGTPYHGGSSAHGSGTEYHGGPSDHGAGTDYHGGSSGQGLGTGYQGGSSVHGTEYHGGSSNHGSGTPYHGGSSAHGSGTEYHGGSSVHGTEYHGGSSSHGSGTPYHGGSGPEYQGGSAGTVHEPANEVTCSSGDRGKFPYARDPRYYIVCGIGVKPRLEQCPPGEAFEAYSRACIPSGKPIGLPNYTPPAHLSDLMCPAGIEGLFPHPFDRTTFLNCKTGKIAVQHCSKPGQVFSISRRYCHPKTQLGPTDCVGGTINHEDTTMLTECPRGMEGHHPYPYDAGRYVRCEAGGKLSIVSCGEDMAYSFVQRACRPRSSVTFAERVRFFSELQILHYGQSDSQSSHSVLKACPPQLRGNYVYPFHAGYFVLCQNGLLQVEACPAGHVYSLSSRSCSPRQQLSAHDFLDYSYISVQLSTNLMQDFTTVTCPANAQGYYLHPFDCTKYLFCHDQQTSIESCEGSEVFSISQRRCVARDQLVAAYDRVEYLTETQHEFSQGNQATEGRQLYPSVHGAVVCPNGFQGVLAHPYDCTKFLNCVNGEALVQSCTPGSAFNALSGVCDVAQYAGCRVRPGPGAYLDVPTALAPDNLIGIPVGAASQGIVCPAHVSGIFAHPFDARSYIYCSESQTLIRQCQNNEVFSLSHNRCQAEHLVPKSDRYGLSYAIDHSLESLYSVKCPRGAEGSFPYPFDCTQFLSCEGGVTRLLSCPQGQHFSVSTSSCRPLEQVQRKDRVFFLNELYLISDWLRQLEQLDASSSVVCPPGVTRDFQHPTLPHKFISCSRGLVLDCPAGQLFSVSRGLCLGSSQVPDYDRCNYRDQQASGSYGWIDLSHDHREPKAYGQPSHGSLADQYSSSSDIRTTVTGGGNRWSNMNMDRPAGIGFKQPPGSGWSGHGIHYSHQGPSQSVLYVEGSMQPNRNYQPTTPNSIYKAPLAPMSPRPSFDDAPTRDWRTAQRPHNHLDTLGGQRPVDLDYEPDERPRAPDQSAPRDQQPSPTHHRPRPHSPPPLPANHSPSFHPPADESNLYGGLQPPAPSARAFNFEPTNVHPAQPGPDYTSTFIYPTPAPGQRPLDLDYNPAEGQPSSNFNPSHKHPLPPAPVSPGQRPLDLGYQPASSSPSQPVADESNLFGGLQPPPRPASTESTTVPTLSSTPSNVRTFPIYPPVFNATPPLFPQYSPSYAGVMHAHNASWQKVPPRGHVPDPFNDDNDDDFEDIDSVESARSTTERSSLRPPPFNHEFYNPPADTNAEVPSRVALGKALRLMLRPYFNHSGNAEEAVLERAESAIASAIRKPPTSTTPRSVTTTTTTTTRTRTKLEDDVELVVAGEQASLATDDDDSIVADAGETARTEQTLNPTTYASGYDTTDYQRSTRRAETENSENASPVPNPTPGRWHGRSHNPDYHRHRHPHPHHGHFQHDPVFHARHPNIPDPFERQPAPHSDISNELLEEDVDRRQPEIEERRQNPDGDFEMVDPNEIRNRWRTTSTTPRPRPPLCEFDCGNGKCLKRTQLCDGINQCGNRRDESACTHLGYQLRLVGGESANAGRIEVKVNGRWGNVCGRRFGVQEANVVCRELNFTRGAAEVRGQSYYKSEGNPNFQMDMVSCQGNETHLKDCNFSGWGVHQCYDNDVAGVVCKVNDMRCPKNFWLCPNSNKCIPFNFVCDGTPDCMDQADESQAICSAPLTYRLVGPTDSQGRLEVRYRGLWGSVCDDDFSRESAQVACNSLGFYGRAEVQENVVGPCNGPIWLDQVMCHGNETSIDQCRHANWGVNKCDHSEDVSIRCSVGPKPRTPRIGGVQRGFGTNNPFAMDRTELQPPEQCGVFKEVAESFEQGNVARRARHPWQASIRKRKGRGTSSHWCGAVVISKYLVLTAAHCIYGQMKGEHFVRVGDHALDVVESSELEVPIDTWYTHEQFRRPTHMNNDIAMVLLKTPLQFNAYVQPICLPAQGAPLPVSMNCTISGWGTMISGLSRPLSLLRYANVPVFADEMCQESDVYGDAMTEGMFCAGRMDESTDACQGDSGGPLVCQHEDHETLYGLMSWGQHCGRRNKPGVYARVSNYIDWIYDKLELGAERLGRLNRLS